MNWDFFLVFVDLSEIFCSFLNFDAYNYMQSKRNSARRRQMQNTDETPQTVTLAVVGDGNRIKPYEELTLMDDFMFGKIMSDKENCKKLLEIILHIDPATEIADPISQNSFRVSPGAKSIIVDIRTSDALNDYDIEAQKQNHPDLPKRARYYQAMMDIDFLRPGKEYTELKNNYIIFICLHDLFGKGLPVYTFQNRCAEDNFVILGDCTTKVFLNAEKCDKIKDKELKAFMEYVKTGQAETPYTDFINKMVKDAQENPYWKREYMDAMMAAVHQEKEIRKAEHNARLETARNALAMGLTAEQAAQIAGLSLDEVKVLQET